MANSQASAPVEVDRLELSEMTESSASSWISIGEDMVEGRSMKTSKAAQNVATKTFLIGPLGIPSPLKHNRGITDVEFGCQTQFQIARSLRTSMSSGVSTFK